MKKLPFDKVKEKKLIPMPRLKKKAWEAFSLWVRFRGNDGKGGNTCISCGKNCPIMNMDAGHFIHGKWKMSGFYENNVFAQCVYCNLGLAGNQANYERVLIDRFGQEEVDKIKHLSKQGWKPSRQELEDLIQTYKTKLADLTQSPRPEE